MGLFNFFKKKATGSSQNNIVRTEVPPFDKNSYLLNILKSKLIDLGYQVENHTQYLALIVNSEIEIATIIIENQENHSSVLQVMASVKHLQYLPEGILESFVGVGISFEEQVSFALQNFINTVLLTIIDGLSDTHNPDLDFYREEVLWHPKLGTLHIQGQWDACLDNEFCFELLKPNIQPKLTLNKFNWLKIYMLKQLDGTLIGECTFNNEQWEKGTNIMSEYEKTWQINGEFQGLKQFIIFRKCDKYD